MRNKVILGRWRSFLAVASLGVLPLSLSLARPTPDTPPSDRAAVSQNATDSVPAGYERRTIRIGPGLPANLSIPVAPPVTVDYRNDEGTLSRLSGQPVSIGGRTPSASGSVAAAPAVCRNDAQCNDCNPCTLDACATSTCTGGTRNGFECDVSEDCGGVCAGGVRDAKGCTIDLDCCGDPVQAIVNGTCNFFPCTALTDFLCVNPVIPDVCSGGTNDRLPCTTGADCTGGGTCVPQFVAGADCDDGLECNGQETCGAGACIAGTPLCTTPQVCDEAKNTCLAECTNDALCEVDGDACTVDKCDLTTGLCFVDPILPCGPGSTCEFSAKSCETGGAPCTVNADCAVGACKAVSVTVCGTGRCCSATGACTNTTFAACEASSGSWRFSSTGCGEIGTTGIQDACPAYGGGIGPTGTFGVEVGEISTSQNLCTGGLIRVGDDYTAAGAPTANGFIDVHIVRFVHSSQVSARFAIEFWDVSDELNPVFVEDVFSAGNTGVHGPLVRTLLFDPPLRVRESGVLAISVAPNFTPAGVISMVSTDAVDVGVNEPTKMFVNGALVSNFLGKCSGGQRDALFCNFSGGSPGCPGGVCNNIDDILAFEIVASADLTAPLGGCCDVAAGTCLQELPWVCDQQGNNFRGAGVNCAVCLASNNDGTPCDTAAECRICVGLPPAAGMVLCTADADCTAIDLAGTCPAGGVCTEAVCELNPATPCLLDSDCTAPGDKCVLIAQCTVQACCNDTDGSCSVVVGTTGLCPAGTTSLGFASSCSPDACPQFPDKSADNCLDIIPTFVPVPAPGDPPNSATLTGSNVAATFDDWNAGVCVDAAGANGAACDPNAAVDPCPAGATCTRLCNSGIFDPTGGTRDPGWWVSFSIDRCADVRIDTCESKPIVQPGWAFLSEGCPCINFLGNDGVRAPVGRGVGTPGFARGLPFCTNDDNLWQTFRNLPAGTYYYPILSDPDAIIAPPVVGGPGGTFQFHVTVAACEIAACCLPQSFCVNADSSIAGINLDGSGVPIPCATDPDCAAVAGATCEFCAEDTQTNCDLAIGNWLSAPVTPGTVCEGGANNGLLECVDDGDCPGGFCRTVGTSILCSIGATSPCDTGACCQGAGLCDDRLPGGAGQMDRITCDASNGTFFGGAKCDFPTPPCPVCTIASIPGNCQLGTGPFFFTMDRQNGEGRKVADDFIAVVPQIGQFCFSPCYIVPGQFGRIRTGGGACADPNGAVPPPEDKFQVRFFENVNGFPGAELASSPGTTILPITAKRWRGTGNCWDYSIVFNPPIDGFVIGQRYWIEFSGAGSPAPPLGTGCTVFLEASDNGNKWALEESDDFDGSSWTVEDYLGIVADASFCIEGGLASPPPMIGCCCHCDGTKVDNVPWEDCLQSTNNVVVGGNGGANDIDPEIRLARSVGIFFPEQECIDIVCNDIGSAGGGCPGQPSGIIGENCANPEILTLTPNVTETRTVDTLCSDTDGRPTFVSGPCTFLPGEESFTSFEQDKWFEFTSTCEGLIQIDTCGDSNFDVAIAVYSDGTGTCPTGSGGCEPDEDVLLGGRCINVRCSASQGRATFETATTPGICYKLRVGGDADAGRMQLEVRCLVQTCRDSVPPVPDEILSGSGALVQSVKNRFLSFKAPVPGLGEGLKAIRVKFVSLPGPFSIFNDTFLWVDTPKAVSELPGIKFSDAVQPEPSFLVSGLVTAPVKNDWSQFGMIHIFDERIIPSRKFPGQPVEPAIYHIQIVDTDTCSLGDEASFSAPLIIQTPQWGDISELIAGEHRAPNGSVGVEDTLAIIAKFSGDGNAPIKARAELLGVGQTGPIAPVDGVISVSDLLEVLSAFSGGVYPFSPPALDPAPSGLKAVTSR